MRDFAGSELGGGVCGRCILGEGVRLSRQRGLQVLGVFRNLGVQPGGADDSDHRPELSSLYTANVNCRVLNKGRHDDALGSIHSYFDFRKMTVGLSSVKQFPFD